MLSDEERKAVDKIKTLIQYLNVWKENFTIVPEDVKYLVTILNLIKKQQKEIEELKKPKYIIDCKTNEITTLTNDFVSKNKIKAKIQELDKVLNEDIYVIDGHYDDRYYRYLQDKHILQSLLEKE